ncbi:DUF1709-domain-containing protein [Pseudovirgaria hyperparasitica]|uniref:DUF1709-domain-containing protein n=1 Tax=Pseudovirgaria hyperparasitica TaxID=470096 RepID=A0A6A6WMB8_9PEZI|nr:DUF1709-domain-containing protein [Pseudovirgaria hyperparasitica]KAF2763302.1 DUF1709-domain-containing protein [Pseudovirgaria hyperparasitica]
MSSETVSPLRISKTTPMSSPSKSSGQRPLSEIGSTSQRRNSPSFNQATKKMMFTNAESSPYDPTAITSSTRLFWKERDPASPSGRFNAENSFSFDRESSPSPKRSSIENLKKASRVKNSSMFAREQKTEYDPTAIPQVERPLAAGRPLSTQVHGNAYGGRGLEGFREGNSDIKGHQRGNSQSRIPMLSPTKSPGRLPMAEYTTSSSPPPKERQSPVKSSLSNGRPSAVAKAYDIEGSIWSEDDDTAKISPARALRRHAKSVTFEQAPPQINEYEMITPEPSSVASGSREGSYDSFGEYDEDDSFEQAGSIMNEDSFDASLEDTDKTPVVLPEDWRHMSPDAANTSLADTFEDPFEGRDLSPMPSAQPNGTSSTPNRNGSGNSEGSRPLPALPKSVRESIGRGRRESAIGLPESADSSQRSLPSPPRASVTKAEILGMRDNALSLEERFRLMDVQNSPDQNNSRLSYGSQSPQKTPKAKKQSDIVIHEDSILGDIPDLGNFQAPKISRESILRKVKSQKFEHPEEEYDDDHERSYGDLADLDPDVPIPSREASSNFDEYVGDFQVKTEQEDISHYSIPDMYSPERDLSRLDDYDMDESVIRHDVEGSSLNEEDEGSVYSSQSNAVSTQKPASDSTSEDEGPPTPKPGMLGSPKSDGTDRSKITGLPDFSAFSNTDFDVQLRGLMKGSPNPHKVSITDPPKLEAARQFLQRSITPEDGQVGVDSITIEERSATPDSVIHHDLDIEPAERVSPVIPEPEATIKASGGTLKIRPSLTPADAAAMAATRRQVSGEVPPPIPDRSPRRSLGPAEMSEELNAPDENGLSRIESLRKMKLDLSIHDTSEDLSFDMDKEFDRVVEAQKVHKLFPLPSYATFPTTTECVSGGKHVCGRPFGFEHSGTNVYTRKQKGYVTRENAKLVVANNRDVSNETKVLLTSGSKSAGSSPRKASHERAKTWTTEPWNGKVRRKSIRSTSGSQNRSTAGPAPPLPGQESAVNAGLDTLMENQASLDAFEDEQERGRLFVKVVGVKDLNLPLPRKEKTWFQLTLDNGLHCVTTSWLELSRNAPIGQEFELTVQDDLEFNLALQTKLQAPPKPAGTVSPTKTHVHKKTASLSRFLASPKKRKEMERKQQEESDRAAQEAQAARRNQEPTAWDLLHDRVCADGTFGRSYVSLKNHERQAYGRPTMVDIPCFNEWTVEDAVAASSARSKHGGVVTRPPYRIGKLTLQLLFVPRPKKATDDDMPKSMNACIRELQEAEQLKDRSYEGHLSQQGGDCPYWRRRFFKLHGSKLTAYHESTRQPRATINLAKATKLVDDRSKLTQPTETKSGGRRKSAFSEEEEGYMFVEEGFRIRFANGETIDFYADSAEQKEGWMKILHDTVGKESAGRSRAWTELVLEKERKEREKHTFQGVPHGPAAQMQKAQAIKEAAQEREMRRPSSAGKAMPASKTAPNSPQKAARECGQNLRDKGDLPPPPVEKDHKPHPTTGTPRARTNLDRRGQVKSMMF